MNFQDAKLAPWTSNGDKILNICPLLSQDILHDQNDINESTRIQLDAISTALAELQSKEPKPRRKIGFIQGEDG